MKASELRIGNWVKLADGYYSQNTLVTLDFQVAGFNGNDLVHWRIPSVFGGYVCSGCYIEHDIEPIPITEEWLIKFGFDFNGMSIWRRPNRHHVCVDERTGAGSFIYRVPGVSLTTVQYVHQLQNIYFALTGEELTSS